MKIINTPFILYIRRYQPENNKENSGTIYQTNPMELLGADIPFRAIYGIKSEEKILEKKFKLIKKLETIIAERKKSTIEVVCKELLPIFNKYKNTLLNKFLDEEFRKNPISRNADNEYINRIARELNNKFEDKYQDVISEKITELSYEVAKIKNQRENADNNDYKLLNELYSTLIQDDLNLTKTYKNYYNGLKDLTLIKDLKDSYPKIKIPQLPEDVIAKKIVKTLPRSFYLNFQEKFKNSNKDDVEIFLTTSLNNIFEKLSTENNIDKKYLIFRLLNSIINQFVEMYTNLNNAIGFASIPENIKLKEPIISSIEKDLLSINYDKYVLDIIKQLYLEDKKISGIKYVNGNIKFSLISLPKEYKFEMPDKKVKQILTLAENLKQEERNYEKFDNETLKERLHVFFEKGAIENEFIMDKMIEFNFIDLSEQDRNILIKFLRVLDDVVDEKISINEAKEIIERDNLYLKEISTDENLKSKKEELLLFEKQEVQAIKEFNNYTRKYDEAINYLFKNKLEESATICMTYKPTDKNASQKISDKFLKLIIEYKLEENVLNSKRLDKKIKELHAYYETKIIDTQNSIIKEAENFAKLSNGEIDEIKAGEYILKSRILEDKCSLSTDLSINENKIISDIIKFSKNKEDAIKNLIKFDDFLLLEEKKQNNINTILFYLDINTDSDKKIIQSIINNIYVQNPTYITTIINQEKNITTESIMTEKAKNEIIKDKPYPLCIKYFQAFEKSMSRIGQSKEDDAIQIVGTNNKTLKKQYKQEVKISMDERLYASVEDYVFDTYSSGLHKLKTSKA